MLDASMCSRTFHRMQVREIGRWLDASDLSPFLYIGVTLALHQSVGSLPVSKDRSKITLIMGASSTRSSFQISGLILSGPVALPGFRSESESEKFTGETPN